MFYINFNKSVKCPWTKSGVQKVFDKIQKKIKLNGELEINIVGDKDIKDLNFRFRGINRTTDVLSFAWQEDKVIKTKSLGQIYICYPQIARQAKELSVDVKEEFARMLTHGLLHIMGYDHVKKQDAKKMFKIQEEVVCLYTGC